MAGRRTNLALLVLLGSALGTGALSFALGSGWGRWAVAAHGAVGFGIVLLSPWKSVIARRGVARRRPGRTASVAFAALVVLVVASGVLHSTGLLRSVGGVTAMQVHVGAALVAVPLAAVHLVTRRIRVRRTDLARRNLLRAAALGAGSLAVYGAAEGVVRVAGLAGGRRRFTGSFEQGSFEPSAMPVTQWLDDRVPSVDGDAWRLTIRGATGARAVLWEELDSAREPVEATIDCTGGWFATQRWEGVPLDRLLGPLEEARSIRVRSLTGYARRYPPRDAGRLWLATRAGGEPLSAGHGFPARIVAPGRRGFWWVKWVDEVEASSAPWWWQPPFPLT